MDIYLQNTPTPKTLGTLWERQWKDMKSQRIREFAVRLSLPVMSKYILIKFHQHDCPNVSGTRMTLIDMVKQTGKSPRGLNPKQRTTDN